MYNYKRTSINMTTDEKKNPYLLIWEWEWNKVLL